MKEDTQSVVIHADHWFHGNWDRKRPFYGLLVLVGLALLMPHRLHQLLSLSLSLGRPVIPPTSQWDGSNEGLKELLLSVPDAQKVRDWSLYYTSESHLPGEGHEQAEWTQGKWHEFGIQDVKIASYDVDLTLPRGQRVALLEFDLSLNQHLLHEASLAEDPRVAGRAKPGGKPFISAFLGQSASGNVTAPFVFANFGSMNDFQDLVSMNVSLEGKIAIVKTADVSPYIDANHLGQFRGLPVLNAEQFGMLGVVMYTDPEVDGDIVESKGHKPFPGGPARPETIIERGTVNYVGNIPIVPISYIDAIPLLQSLNGQGPKATDLPPRWHGGALKYKGVEYNVGPSPANIVINLYNDVQRRRGTITNVIGSVQGRKFPDEVIIIGNHRDAWGPGAGDPGSGSSALNEVVRSFGMALKAGWQPLRTIVFASFEGEEFGQVGSTPWLHENSLRLNTTAVAYLNVVVAVAGSKFHAKSSPLLNRVILNSTASILSPNQTVPGQTVLDAWGGYITGGSGGDGMRFLSDYCISSLDIGFSAAINDPIFPYHSQFDTVDWMDAYGDPTWEYHVTSAKIWLLMALNLSESPVLPLSVHDYATALHMYVEVLQAKLSAYHLDLDLSRLVQSIQKLKSTTERFERHMELLRRGLYGELPHMQSETPGLLQKIRTANRIYTSFERMFFHAPGLDTEPRLKHVIFPYGAWHADEPPFPGIMQSLATRNITNAYKWEDIIVNRINAAATLLNRSGVW